MKYRVICINVEKTGSMPKIDYRIQFKKWYWIFWKTLESGYYNSDCAIKRCDEISEIGKFKIVYKK